MVTVRYHGSDVPSTVPVDELEYELITQKVAHGRLHSIDMIRIDEGRWNGRLLLYYDADELCFAGECEPYGGSEWKKCAWLPRTSNARHFVNWLVA
ncbi:hypothetical protein [Streptomyces chrestomyceticus]|uniref:Uncharacterized protein n=1 Tax=Streptomyces chrestomyceticus TaxID=68185 RepID=A0ABU7WM79_9ACTN